MDIQIVIHYISNNLTIFDFIKRKGDQIYIITRGIQELVQKYFEHHGLLKYITYIYGAKDDNELARENWNIIKCQMLDDIKQRTPTINKLQMYFFDDTRQNVETAIGNGYINSFNVTQNGCPLLRSIKTIFYKPQLINNQQQDRYKLVHKYTFGQHKFYVLVKERTQFHVPKQLLVMIAKHDQTKVIYDEHIWNYNHPVELNKTFEIDMCNVSSMFN
jgi:hypothetical protein